MNSAYFQRPHWMIDPMSDTSTSQNAGLDPDLLPQEADPNCALLYKTDDHNRHRRNTSAGD